MKIAFYRAEYPKKFNTRTFFKESVGGTEFAAGYLALALAKKHEVFFICQTPHKARIDNIFWLPVSTRNAQVPAEILKKTLKKIGKVDIFILVGGLSNLLDLGPINAQKVICWANGLSLKPNTIEHLLAGKIDQVVCTTNYARDKVLNHTIHHLPWLQKIKYYFKPSKRKFLQKAFTFIYNGVNLKLFPDRDLKKISKKPFKILFAGVFNEQKNPDKILAVFPKVKLALPQAELHMCGSISQYKPRGADSTTGYFDGDLFFNRLKKYLYQKSGALRPGLYLRGALPPHILAREMISASLVVVNPYVGNQESSCIGALEAQAAGTPVIGGGNSALEETIQHKLTGFVFPQQEKLAPWIIQILKHPQKIKKIGRAGRGRALAGFGWPTIAQEWENLLDSLLHNLPFEPRKH